MKTKIFWTAFLGIVGAVIASKDSVVEPTKVGVFALVGAAIGFVLGFVLNKRSNVSPSPPKGQ